MVLKWILRCEYGIEMDIKLVSYNIVQWIEFFQENSVL